MRGGARAAIVALGIALAATGTTARAQPGDAGAGAAAGAGSGAGSGSGAGAGSGSGAGKTIIPLSTDILAPQVTAAASPTLVRLGGKLTVFITATFADGVEVNLREPFELGPALEVTRKLTEDRAAPEGRRTREWQLEVIAWELGDLVVPPISITYTAFGRAATIETNAIRLNVSGVLGDVVDDPKAMRDHAPPTALSARDWFWLWIAGAAGAVGSLVVAALMVWRRRRRRRTIRLVGGAVAPPRRMDMTSARALERLLAIEASGVLERDADRKVGYAEMVEVIRDYLGSRYRVQIFDLTSSELLERLAGAAPPDEYALVETWLAGCDLVKYGGLRASAADARQVLDDARALVVTTTALRAAEAA